MFSKKGIFFLLLALIGLTAYYRHYIPKYGTGEIAPDFEVTLIDGSTKKLSDFRGKMVLLQFWGSWCGPCRAENRWIVPLYETYKDKGLEVFSIGMETNEKRWRAAIAKDAMSWPNHAVELERLDGTLANKFRVKEIPATFLIDTNGEILGVRLHEAEMRKILDEKLN